MSILIPALGRLKCEPQAQGWPELLNKSLSKIKKYCAPQKFVSHKNAF